MMSLKKITPYTFRLWIYAFFYEFVLNDVMHFIPFWVIRRWYFKVVGMKIGRGSFIMKNNYFQGPRHFSIGNYSHINRGCLLDARAPISIGNSVSISHNVNIVTGGHDIQSTNFTGKFLPIQIDDYAWIGVGCTILQGVHIGKGAVICAGALVNKNVGDYEIVAGIPAKKIGTRNNNLKYHCLWELPLT